MYVFDNQLRDDAGRTVARFSSHWAAVAALIRTTDPTFKSLGKDLPEDLAIEAGLSYDEVADAHDSYLEAVQAIGAKVKAGAPIPPFFLSDKPEAAE